MEILMVGGERELTLELHVPEEIFLEALEKIPPKHHGEFIASWLFLSHSPFGKNLGVVYFPALRELQVFSALTPYGVLREERFVRPFLQQVLRFFETFAENLGRYFFPGMKLYSQSKAEVEIKREPFWISILAKVEETARARKKWAVQDLIYDRCVKSYLSKGMVDKLPQNAFKLDKKGKVIPNIEVMEQIPEFVKFRDYLLSKGYIDRSYYPQKDLRLIRHVLAQSEQLIDFCPICGKEIEKPRLNKCTCGSPKCTIKKHRVKKYIQKLLERDPRLTKEEISRKLEEHEEAEVKIKKYLPYRKIKDKDTIVEVILKELQNS